MYIFKTCCVLNVECPSSSFCVFWIITPHSLKQNWWPHLAIPDPSTRGLHFASLFMFIPFDLHMPSYVKYEIWVMCFGLMIPWTPLTQGVWLIHLCIVRTSNWAWNVRWSINEMNELMRQRRRYKWNCQQQEQRSGHDYRQEGMRSSVLGSSHWNTEMAIDFFRMLPKDLKGMNRC